jgi:demethylmenaquinone methyltransferase/2-methoxy-6-polyprenyl-1,4-benzoquinol methylase
LDKDSLVEYYAQRAQEYERVYEKPERQEDLARIMDWLQSELAHKEILEIACGTGYWTQPISRTAKSVLATDINPEVLEIAKAKPYPRQNVRFALHDIYALFKIPGAFNALFGGFIWSHIPLQDLDHFLAEVAKRINAGGKIVFIDNLYVAGNSSPLVGQDEYGNTYQERVLLDGSKHSILKNYPTEEFIRSKLAGQADQVRLNNLQYYWLLSYEKNVKGEE